MPRVSSDGLDGEHTFRRHAPPLGDGAPRYAEGPRNAELHALLGADQLHTIGRRVRLHDRKRC